VIVVTALPAAEQNFHFDLDGTAFARSSFQLVPNISPNGTAHGLGKRGKFRSTPLSRQPMTREPLARD
jgi:hypothetical protein